MDLPKAGTNGGRIYQEPNIFKLAREFPDHRTYAFADTLAFVGKNMRRYSAASLAEHVRSQLVRAETEGLEALRGAPWLSMLILKWALLDEKVQLVRGESMPAKVYDRLRQRLWSTQDEHLGQDRNVHLMIRRILHAQFGFQHSLTRYLLLWPALLVGIKDQNAKLRVMFRQTMGMEPEDFLDLSVALFAALNAGKGQVFPTYFTSLRPGYGEKVDRILDLFTRDLQGLRDSLRADPRHKIRNRTELGEFPFTQRHPLIKLQSGAVAWWHSKIWLFA